MTGFSYSSVLAEVAPDYPDTKFGIVDGWAPADNILNIGFTEHEGSFLVGMLAGLKSNSGVVGFIGGQDIPLIRRFGCGYAQGVIHANADAKVVANMTGTTGAAWNDPVKGSELTRAQISQGADVVFAAAGGTGVGVLQTAADENILSIGVDSNQNYLHPGKVLTSMIKRVDVAIYNAFTDGTELESGAITLNLANEGVGYAMDEYNADLVSTDMVAAVDAAKANIISGDLAVHDYMSDNSCPVLNF
jgi:basic membrane protein A